MGALAGLAALLNAVRFADVDPNAGDGPGTAGDRRRGRRRRRPISGGRGHARRHADRRRSCSARSARPWSSSAPRPQWEKAIQGAIILLAVASDALDSEGEREHVVADSPHRGPARGAPALEPAQRILLALLRARGRGLRASSARTSSPPATPSRSLRLSVEIGLLALALTPVIVTGGIDLSVGSLMGLSAVLFGKLWRDAGLPIAAGGGR